MVRHMLIHEPERAFKCDEHHLKAHLFTHTGLRPYSCPHCHRAFNQKANMVRHMLIHEPERAFKCDVCSKTFTQPQTLKAHMVVHSDKKPYSCKFCGKQFGRQHNLQGHLHMHMNSKPYVCSICQASFTLKGNLNRHKKVKHGLNESTENMEEDAVNFLSSFSNHTRDAGTSETELDTNSHDDHMSPDSKSSKKGRKSTPKKRITQQMYNESEDDFENIEGSDNEESDIISYSDEERENETRLSKYFTVNENDTDETGIKRKRKVAVALFKNMEGNSYELDVSDNVLDNESDVDFQRETNIDGVIEKTHNSSFIQAGVTRFYNNTDDIQNEFSDSKNVKLNTTEGSNGVKIEAVVTEKRSKRKRKKKELDDDFLSDVEEIENYSNDIAAEPARKTAKHKGAMLDNIIAAKFKNM